MSELYWLGVLGNLCDFGVCIVALSVLVMLFLAFILVTNTLEGYDKPPICLKLLKLSAVSTLIGFLMCVFIPSTKSLLIIYGVGGTIDYVKENKVANKIPDKCIKALDKYLDDALKEDKDKNKE
jgi:hypothetical protein